MDRLGGLIPMSVEQNNHPPMALKDGAPQIEFEIYVGHGFCDHETAAIARTLQCGNDILGEARFRWRYVSETPGLVDGTLGMIVRAQPLVPNHALAKTLFVVGGQSGRDSAWMSRLRQMSRLSRPCVLFSDAATAYIKRTKSPPGKITTHWRDAVSLQETNDLPNLTNRLAERSGNIITGAGSGATCETVISLLAPYMSPVDLAELGNRLLLPVVRKGTADQPNDITALPALSDARMKSVVQVMEESLESPFNIYELSSRVGVSTRHLERMFKSVFNQTPARFYKQLRTKRARTLVEETQLPMVEIAIATGFGSSSSLNDAIKKEYGLTATKMRARQS